MIDWLTTTIDSRTEGLPVITLPIRTWICNAAAVISKTYGAVTEQARIAGCSRETVYQHARQVEQRLAETPGPEHAKLLAENRRLRDQLAELTGRSQPSIPCGPAKLRQVATVAFACGVSLRQIEDIFAALLGPATAPDHSTIGRWVAQEAKKAKAVLEPIDAACVAEVKTLAIDEVFWGRPTLVGIEPSSMTAVFCHNAKDRTGASWYDQLAPFNALEFAVSDAAKGIAAGLAQVVQQRRSDDDPTPLVQGLDLFHTVREARTVLGGVWRIAEAAWKKAEAIDVRMARSKRAGVDARGVAQTSAAAWRRAESALERAQTQEDAWARVEAAFELFDPEGRLNDRTRAQAQIAGALPELGGEAWARTRNFLGDHRSLAFLDRMHERLAEAEPRADWREAMAWRWWGRHRRPSPASCPGSELVRSVAWGRRLSDEEQESYARVSAVLGDTVRASSAVECMNSVLRMQQSRHKVMTQAMLDLKRLYWNCHATKQGRRKGASPYQHLGLDLPSFDFWELLQTDPKSLTQELSGKEDAT